MTWSPDSNRIELDPCTGTVKKLPRSYFVAAFLFEGGFRYWNRDRSHRGNMKYLKQFLIILMISLLGEVLKIILPFPVPASIYGLILMFAVLLTGILRLGQVKETADFLLEIMPVMFIPASVGILDSWDLLSPIFAPVIIITLLTTAIVMSVAGRVTQFVIRYKEDKKE